MKILYIILFCVYISFALAAEWDCSTTSGVFTQSTNCTVSSVVAIKDSTSLKITGIPDVNGVMPKIIGAVGLNRLFRVEGGGELILNGLNLTAGIEVRVDFFCREGAGGVCYDGSLAGYDASTNGDTTNSSYLAALSGFKHPDYTRNYAGWHTNS